MIRLTAAEVARRFSWVISRVGAGEVVKGVRNGVLVAQLRPIQGLQVVSAARWRELMDNASAVDDDFERDAETSREAIGPPDSAWPS